MSDFDTQFESNSPPDLTNYGSVEKHRQREEVYYAEDAEVTESQIRQILSDEYAGDNSRRELVKNERQDNHDSVGSVVYSLSGSPPKGYAIHNTGLNSEMWFLDVHGRRFAEVMNVRKVVENE